MSAGAIGASGRAHGGCKAMQRKAKEGGQDNVVRISSV